MALVARTAITPVFVTAAAVFIMGSKPMNSWLG